MNLNHVKIFIQSIVCFPIASFSKNIKHQKFRFRFFLYYLSYTLVSLFHLLYIFSCVCKFKKKKSIKNQLFRYYQSKMYFLGSAQRIILSLGQLGTSFLSHFTKPAKGCNFLKNDANVEYGMYNFKVQITINNNNE